MTKKPLTRIGMIEVSLKRRKKRMDPIIAVNTMAFQGYELSVLKGASETLQKYKPTLLIETISAGRDISLPIGKFLSQFGYKQIKKFNYS